jgi:hypothetical protein
MADVKVLYTHLSRRILEGACVAFLHHGSRYRSFFGSMQGNKFDFEQGQLMSIIAPCFVNAQRGGKDIGGHVQTFEEEQHTYALFMK